ncbi:hypothetical protein OQJ68_11930 [Microbulbifer thermotolerans]|uniref:DUF2846 domain-containing protein n=1 Tax=Microbulbifer thermotolerans TaxID=252514 RepID=A0AB35HYT4_MICTH|nr:hypothetical protein [Microbulbifer thermotolerans]MCX2802495.1 hypothetical protein [Microbulbifer thermotolerans]
MQKIKIISLLLFITIAVGCAPARIVSIPAPAENEKSTLLVYRESAFNAGGVGLIFGADSRDYVKLGNSDYSEIELKNGHYKFFVRSDQADKPYILAEELKAGDKKCLKAYANPANLGKALVPLAYYMSHTFLLEKIECPSEEELSKYRKVPVKYTDA